MDNIDNDLDIDNQGEQVQAPDTLIIDTKGKWQPIEAMIGKELEVGKMYKIEIGGQCELAISKERPTGGMGTHEIYYTKDNVNKLWIRTGGK